MNFECSACGSKQEKLWAIDDVMLLCDECMNEHTITSMYEVSKTLFEAKHE